MASREAVTRHGFQGGALLSAPRHREGAAGVEVTPCRRGKGRWYFALHRSEHLTTAADARRTGEKGLCVGMVGGVEQSRGRCLLDHAAEIHHNHMVAHMTHHAEVVADEEVGQPIGFLEFEEQVEIWA
jgi:hypothetical protein